MSENAGCIEVEAPFRVEISLDIGSIADLVMQSLQSRIIFGQICSGSRESITKSLENLEQGNIDIAQ